ncbi:MAG: hypothetical protein ACPK85_06315 [Methanosarcina sp.]
MTDLNKLKRELETLDVSELFEYVKKNYPENEELGLGSKKIVIRKILNFERNKMNEQLQAEE